MPQSYVKKLAVIGNASAPMTDSKKNVEEASWNRKLKIVKCMTCNVKLIKSNKEVSVLIDYRNESNLISWGYTALLSLKILDIL